MNISFSLYQRGQQKKDRQPPSRDSMVKSAQMFSADCCKDIFNYVSKDFGKKLDAF